MTFYFNASKLEPLAERARESFAGAAPFPHAIFDNYLPTHEAEAILRDFPNANHSCWSKSDHKGLFQPGKQELGDLKAQALPDSLTHILREFNSAEFLTFLEHLSGIDHLIPDPYFKGGGVHRIEPGGSLAVHTDYNFHTGLCLFRRLNLLFYLNKDWSPDFGGNLELWDSGMTSCVTSITPDFNRMVVFNITAANHGHPEPLRCPPDRCRQSLALYYYTVEPDPNDRKATISATWQKPIWAGDFLEQVLAARLRIRPDRAGLAGIMTFKVTGERTGCWTVNLAAGTVLPGEDTAPDCAVSIDSRCFSDVLTNRMAWEQAFSRQRIRVTGDASLFITLFDAI